MTPEPNDLLADVVAEAVPADFRAALLADTLRQVGRRRRVRRVQRTLASVTCATLVFGALWLTGRWHSSLRPALPYVAVSTVALPPESIVTTAPLPLAFSAHEPAVFVVIHTRPANLKILDDRQLLAALPNAALIRIGQTPTELVIR